MAPYIPPVVFSKEKIAWELMKLVLHTVGRRFFEDNCERETLKLSTARSRLHAALNRRYNIPTDPAVTHKIPPRIKTDHEVMAYWKAMQPDPFLVKEWHVKKAERMLLESDWAQAERENRSFDHVTKQLDQDYELGQAAYETDLAQWRAQDHRRSQAWERLGFSQQAEYKKAEAEYHRLIQEEEELDEERRRLRQTEDELLDDEEPQDQDCW